MLAKRSGPRSIFVQGCDTIEKAINLLDKYKYEPMTLNHHQELLYWDAWNETEKAFNIVLYSPHKFKDKKAPIYIDGSQWVLLQ